MSQNGVLQIIITVKKKKYFKWCFFINGALFYLILNLVIPLFISNTGKTSIYTWCNGEAVTISRGREMIHRPLYPRWLTTKYCYYCMWAEYQHVSMATCYFFSSLSESLSASRYGVHFKCSKQFAQFWIGCMMLLIVIICFCGQNFCRPI